MLNALKDFSEEKNYNLRIYPYDWQENTGFSEELELCGAENDAAIIFPPYYQDHKNIVKLEKLFQKNYPVLFIEHIYARFEDMIPCVSVDYYSGFKNLFSELKKTCKSFAFLIDPEHPTGKSLMRLVGELKIKNNFIKKGHFEKDKKVLFTALEELLAVKHKPDIIFCFSSQTILKSFLYLNSKGVKVPEDIAIAGSGNISVLSDLLIPIPALSLPRAEMGRKAGRVISQLINKENVTKNIKLKPEPIFLNENSCIK
jgi:DNA-binding LacI/PurR family transcriptional regulator